MKIICDSRKLTEAFSLAASVAPNRSPKEILRNVQLKAYGNTLVLSATDMEVGIRVTISEGVEVIDEGTVLLNVQRTRAILQENTDETIAIDSKDGATHITAARSRYRLQSENPDEFPSIDATIGDTFIEVPARLLGTMIKRTSFATDMESSRYALGGINIETDDQTLIAIGTDGRRLAKFSGVVTLHGEASIRTGSVIIPSRAAALIERAIGLKSDDVVRLSATINDITVEGPNCMIYSRLVEGRYPNWRQVFPKREFPSTVNAVAGPLHAAVRQAAIACDNESRGIDMTFSESGIRLEAKTADIGESSVELPASGDFANEGSITLKCDFHFVVDFLKVIDGESAVVMEFETGNAPMLMSTEDGYQYIIMPMAIDR
jgi:DNA polymerase III subunit beta